MALEAAFLDAIRGRITLSGLIGRSLKLDKAGREFKACCPFHGEKSPSFTVNDAKGFYHCFGCGVHGDVFRWLTDHQGMGFMDAVKDLAQEAALNEAVPAYRYLFDALAERLGESPTPEAIAAVWAELAEMAGSILDAETRAQYLGLWRARYERELSSVPQVAAIEQVHAVTPAEDGDYAFPESADDSHRRLIAIVRAALKKRAERREITEELADLMKMAEAIGFVKKEINAVIRDIESDLDHGPGRREEAEMARVLYRRTLGIHGPMNEAMLPQIIDGRPRGASAQVQRKATMHALIDARAVEI